MLRMISKRRLPMSMRSFVAGGAERRVGQDNQSLAPGGPIITVLATENAKREGSSSHARFALLETGMTVAEFVKAAVRAGAGRSAGRPPPVRFASVSPLRR